jgi:signal transduction histidine kinase
VTDESLVDRLAAHRVLAGATRGPLEWLAARGELVRLNTGDVLTPKGVQVRGLFVILSGHFALEVDRGAGAHTFLEWRGGDVTGVLPYSRLVAPPGDVTTTEPGDVLLVPREQMPSLIRECHELTAIFVHEMIDRDRIYSTNALREEKVASLGKLAAGLAHELNNPASAVTRSAERLEQRLADLGRSAHAIGALRLSAEQEMAVERARMLCVAATGAGVTRSAVERADREDTIADWLDANGVDGGNGSAASALAASAVTLGALDQLARALDGDALRAVMAWLVADCETRQLAAEISTAGSRITDLVARVKGFTYMDQAEMPKAVDVGKGLAETIAVLEGKARTKGVRVRLDVEPDLPHVHGMGGELNQVWAGLIDNALDAAASEVVVTACRQRDSVAVRVVDDGRGVPAELRERIFDPFFTTKPQGQGIGLGLDVARRIVRRHQGEIELEPRVGRTEFRVTLPCGA